MKKFKRKKMPSLSRSVGMNTLSAYGQRCMKSLMHAAHGAVKPSTSYLPSFYYVHGIAGCLRFVVFTSPSVPHNVVHSLCLIGLPFTHTTIFFIIHHSFVTTDFPQHSARYISAPRRETRYHRTERFKLSNSAGTLLAEGHDGTIDQQLRK